MSYQGISSGNDTKTELTQISWDFKYMLGFATKKSILCCCPTFPGSVAILK